MALESVRPNSKAPLRSCNLGARSSGNISSSPPSAETVTRILTCRDSKVTPQFLKKGSWLGLGLAWRRGRPGPQAPPTPLWASAGGWVRAHLCHQGEGAPSLLHPLLVTLSSPCPALSLWLPFPDVLSCGQQDLLILVRPTGLQLLDSGDGTLEGV